MTRTTFTDLELEIFEYRRRYNYLCDMVAWDRDLREAGQALIIAQPHGWTTNGLAEYLNIPRATLQRRLTLLIDAGVAERRRNKMIHTTELGARLHIKYHCAFDQIAKGNRVGIPKDLLDALFNMRAQMENVPLDISSREELEKISFFPNLNNVL